MAALVLQQMETFRFGVDSHLIRFFCLLKNYLSWKPPKLTLSMFGDLLYASNQPCHVRLTMLVVHNKFILSVFKLCQNNMQHVFIDVPSLSVLFK